MNEWLDGWFDEALSTDNFELGNQLLFATEDFPISRFLPKFADLYDFELIDEHIETFLRLKARARTESDERCRTRCLARLHAQTELEPWIRTVIKMYQPVVESPKPEPVKRAIGYEYSRNDWVLLVKGEDKQELKFKKAAPLLADGWTIVGRVPGK